VASRGPERLAGNSERINIKAYAAEVKDGTAARRLSLSRPRLCLRAPRLLPSVRFRYQR
jgi:hypothetical protein